jgi:hypothetical protein
VSHSELKENVNQSAVAGETYVDDRWRLMMKVGTLGLKNLGEEEEQIAPPTVAPEALGRFRSIGAIRDEG